MQYPVQIEQQNGHYQASVLTIPTLTKTASTRAEALHLIQDALLEYVKRTEIIYVDIPTADDPTLLTSLSEQQAKEHLRELLNRLLHLSAEVGEEEDDWAAKPTEYAIKRALDLVANAYQKVGIKLPDPYLSISSDGGIRIQWIKNDLSLRLVIPADSEGREYIYHEKGESYGTCNVTNNALVTKFYWLIEEWPHGDIANR